MHFQILDTNTKFQKQNAPWSDTYKVVYQSDGQINRPVSYTFTIGDENWKFEVTPKSGWRNNTLLIIIIGMFLTISLLLSVLTRVWLVAKEHKKKVSDTGAHRFSYKYL